MPNWVSMLKGCMPVALYVTLNTYFAAVVSDATLLSLCLQCSCAQMFYRGVNGFDISYLSVYNITCPVTHAPFKKLYEF